MEFHLQTIDSKESYKELGCSVGKILNIMRQDEQEHKHANFGSTFLKVTSMNLSSHAILTICLVS